MALLNVEDLQVSLPDVPSDELQQMITDAEAIAAIHAPCITNPTFKHKAAAKAIIRKAIIYDVNAQEEGNNVSKQSTGPHAIEYKTATRNGAFYSKSQIDALKALCVVAAPGMYSVQLGL